MIDVTKVLYTASATAVGGRAGHVSTDDGRLDIGLDIPAEMGGSGGPGTNPEQLFAAGYAACFQSTLLSIARGRKLDISEARIHARVSIGQAGGGGFALEAALDLDAPQISAQDAAELMTSAHALCPYSRRLGTTSTSPSPSLGRRSNRQPCEPGKLADTFEDISVWAASESQRRSRRPETGFSAA